MWITPPFSPLWTPERRCSPSTARFQSAVSTPVGTTGAVCAKRKSTQRASDSKECCTPYRARTFKAFLCDPAIVEPLRPNQQGELMVRQGHYDRIFIGGSWVEPATAERIEVISPVTEEPIASVPAGAPSDIDRAVVAARAAFEGGWAKSPMTERVGILERLRNRLVQVGEEMAQVITAEMGCPITQSRNIQVVAPLGTIDAHLELARTYPFREVRHSPGGAAALIVREPVGVVGAVIPWNVPLGIAVSKIVPAILTGCTVVLKPSPEAPLSPYFLAELLDEVGLPPGVVNVVPGGRETGEHLVTHAGVDKVTFTGSSAAGRRIASLCGQDLRRVNLELGGKSAAVVLDDADLDTTVEALRLGSFRNSGQICTLKTRVLVSQRRHDELVDRLVDLVTSMPL